MKTRSHECTVGAFDLRNGEALWQVTAKIPPDTRDKKSANKPRPLKPQLAYCEKSDVLVLTAVTSMVAAYEGKSGKVLWSKNIPCQPGPLNWRGYDPPILLPDMMITQSGEVYDPRTGLPLKRRFWRGANAGSAGTRGCGRALANMRVVIVRDGHASYFDLATGRHVFLRGIRAGCTNAMVPAGGIINAPNFFRHCTCNYPVVTSFALVPVPEPPGWGRAE